MLCTIGMDRLVRSWACQMSHCSAVQSVSGRRAWGRSVGGSVGSSSVVCSWQMCGDGGREELGGQSGVEWSYPQRQHTQYGRLAIRLRDRRACGRCAMLMVKLSSVECASRAGVGAGGGWSCCWMRRLRRPNVRLLARSGRAGLRRSSLLSMICSCSSESVCSMYLMLSMCGKRGTWSKNDGVGQLQIFGGFGRRHGGGASRH